MVHKYPRRGCAVGGRSADELRSRLETRSCVATLAKEFVLMGGGLYADKGAIDTGAIDARREFNWWFDPGGCAHRAARALEEDDDHSHRYFRKTRYTEELKAAIVEAEHADHPISRQIFSARLHVG